MSPAECFRKCQMSNVPCRMSNLLDQITRRPNLIGSFGQVSLTLDMGRLTFDISRKHSAGDIVTLKRLSWQRNSLHFQRSDQVPISLPTSEEFSDLSRLAPDRI